MHLYNYTLRPASSPLCSVIGQFSKSQMLVVATSNGLEVWAQSEDRLEKVNYQNAFGIIQKIAKIRPIGFDRDLLVITSDSGCITICEYTLKFVPIVQEPHSKNGLRSITPGEYLEVDPQNRAIMVGAVEKKKFVYRVQVDNGKVVLSSPLESYVKGFTISTCAVDNGFENPLFAAIEIVDTKIVLNYYELDQGLNYVIKRTEKIPESANLLVPFEGVMVCCDGFLVHKGKELKFPSQSRIVNYVIHKLKNDFFVLLQNNFGDLFKVDGDRINYFGTIDVCASISIFKNGYMYANTFNGNKVYYQITDLEVSENITELENLEHIQTIDSLDPILDMSVKDSQIITANLSSLKTLIHGVPTTTVVESPLPTTPNKIFTTKLKRDDVNDAYFVISSNETLVLSIGEVVEEVKDSNFSKEPTILVQQVGKLALVQIYANGVKHINNGKVTDWYPPGGINIVRASSNNQQVIIGLTNNEVIYFEIDVDDQLIEYQDKLEVSTNITALALSRDFAVVGCADETIQVISVQQHNCLEVLSLQMLSSNSSSIQFFDQEVHIGMDNGLFVRTSIDIKGKLSNTRIKYLGTKPVKLSRIDDSVLAISSRPWVGFNNKGNFKIVPLNDVDIVDGVSFHSEDIGGDGIVGFQGNDLIIFTIDDLANEFLVSSNETEAKKLITEDHVYTLGKLLVKDEETYNFPETPVCLCKFDDFIVVGTKSPNYLYALKDMKVVFKTEIDRPPQALLQFNDKLLVAVDNILRTYEFGQKHLLKKSSTTIKHSARIIKLVHQGKNRIVIGDSKSSTIFCKFVDNSFIPIADDTMKRQISALTTLDYDTVIGGDKFGNIFINRIKQDNQYFTDDLFLNGSPGRSQTLAQFFLNDIPMSFQKATLVIGGPEVVLYVGIQGTLGVLLPINENDFKFLKTLEAELNMNLLVGRDPMKFRSYYNLSHNVIDGDLIETFFGMEVSKKINVSNKINKSVRDIENKINDYRDRSAF